MESEKIYLDDSDVMDIRKQALIDIYDKKGLSSPILAALKLEVYNHDNNFYDKINRAVNMSYLDNTKTLTNEQMDCLNLLKKGNLFISAPTSFGKTYIALEYIARNIEKLENIVFVVPTIALMDELRKKCYRYFGKHFLLITSEAELDKNIDESKKIMILVPERVNSRRIRNYLDSCEIDLAVYDEVYKLHADQKNKKDNSRIIVMNYAYKYLVENSKKLLLLGPFIKNVSFDRSKIEITKYITNLNLVYNSVNLNKNYFEYFKDAKEKQFIFFRTPQKINKFISENEEEIQSLDDVNYDKDIVEWMSNNVHEEWYYIDFLKKGIGIHHGNTPLFLRKYIEDEYANGYIHTILCTSTLIEGINTPTNKLIVHDVPHNAFELNNLIGRVGRLNTNNPVKGEVVFVNEDIQKLYDPDNWIELEILFETEEIVSNYKEDELLYLEKNNQELTDEIIKFKKRLQEDYNINYDDAIDLGIEYRILYNFVDCLNDFKNENSDFNIIKIMQSDVICEFNKYFTGLRTEKYSFKDSYTEEYLKLYPVYYLLTSLNGVKEAISVFTRKYKEADRNDINIFIDCLFKIDEFIKFQLTKVIPVVQLFELHNLLPVENYGVLIRVIHRIESYINSADGYKRILEDMGFPYKDILEIVEYLESCSNIIGTENKLIKLSDTAVIDKLSPFGKRIINSYTNNK